MFTRELFINIPGPANTLTQIVKADAKRLFLAIALANTNISLGTSTNPNIAQGFRTSFNNQVVIIDWYTWGPFVQSDWYALNSGGLLSNATSYEVITDETIEATADTFRAQSHQNFPRGLQESVNLGRRRAQAAALLPAAELEPMVQTIKGEIWQKFLTSGRFRSPIV